MTLMQSILLGTLCGIGIGVLAAGTAFFMEYILTLDLKNNKLIDVEIDEELDTWIVTKDGERIRYNEEDQE